MEFGPRALGARSIIADARNPEMQKKLNLKIKYREGFRPFAPVVPAEDVSEYFEHNDISPYMLLVKPVKKNRQIAFPAEYKDKDLLDKLYFLRSDLPAITHIDYSARLPPSTINTPISNSTMISGASHHFFLAFIKLQRSFKNSMFQVLVDSEYRIT